MGFTFATFWAQLRELRRMNWLLNLAVLLLLIMGIFFIYSACYTGEGVSRTLYRDQLRYVFLGIGCYFTLAIVPYRLIEGYVWWAYGGALAMLVLVLFIGDTLGGAQRWIDLGIMNVQPSELAKVGVILILAQRLNRPLVDVQRPRTVVAVAALIVIPFLLIMMQPDLGTAIVFLPTAYLMMLVAGIPMRFLGSFAAVGVVSVTLLLATLFLPGLLGADEDTIERWRGRSLLKPHQIPRIETFFMPDLDPLGVGWNKRQSEIAVGSGGLKGKGYLKGTQNILGFLPRSVAPTDFIFAVIAEEMGFFGSAIVLGLFGVVIGAGMLTASRSAERFGRLLCVGITCMVFFHVFINIAMTVGLMPITGLPLPLLSYGGSFMIVMMSGLGIIQSVHIHARRPEGYRSLGK